MGRKVIKDMQLAYIGLGKMGLNMVERLIERGYDVFVYDLSSEAVEKAVSFGAKKTESLTDMVGKLSAPRLVWTMVFPHSAVDSVLKELAPLLQRGDAVIDGGNAFYKDSIRRAQELEKRGIEFLDAGVSGGPAGARNGACIMVGGKREVFSQFSPLFKDLTVQDGYGYMGKSGAGHFVKMVHNGIEYGMMQAIAEGFTILKQSNLDIDLTKVADVYNHKSVIESRLVGWLKDAYEQYGENLDVVSGTVGHTGEGEWTAKIAKEMGVPVPIIEGAFQFRAQSEKNPSYTGKVLSALRNMFGGHSVK